MGGAEFFGWAIAAVSAFLGILGIFYTMKRSSLEKRRYDDAQDGFLGRSISLDILEVGKVGSGMKSPDGPWDPWEFGAVVANIAFCNLSQRPVFLKTVTVRLDFVWLRGYPPMLRFLDRWMAYRFGFSLRHSFRFVEHSDGGSFVTLWDGGSLRVRVPAWGVYRRVLRVLSERLLGGLWVCDSESGELVPSSGWIEVSPGDRKVWDIIVGIAVGGPEIMRETNMELLSVGVSLEFDTCVVERYAKMPFKYWIDYNTLSKLNGFFQ